MLCQAYDSVGNKITNDPRFNAVFGKQHSENTLKIGNFTKNAFSRKKGLRAPATNRRTPFISNADTQRWTRHGPDGSGNADKREAKREENFEVFEAGRAKQVRAHTVSFVSTLFEIDSF
jgi:hypothetical protein